MQNIKKPLVKQRSEAPGKVNKIPYKTCRLLRLLVPFLQNDLKKYQKSIRFFTKSRRRFATLRNVKKALVLDHFGASKKVDQNTL